MQVDTTAYTDDNSLNVDKLYDSLLIPVYYAMSEYLEQGKVWKVTKTKYFPEYIAFHPSDFEMIKRQLPNGYKLVPLRDAPLSPIRLEVRVK